MGENQTIYHIVALGELKKGIEGKYYRPLDFERDGFIHCTAEISTTLLVLEDYFVEPYKSDMILILEIDTSKLHSEVKYEPPAPVQGGGTSHMREGILFPHIYGSLNVDAIVGVGKVERTGGKFIWPSTFGNVREYL